MQKYIEYIRRAQEQSFLNANSVDLMTAAEGVLKKLEYKSSTWAEGENQGDAADNVRKLTLLEIALADIKDAAQIPSSSQAKNNKLDEGPARKKVKMKHPPGTAESSNTLTNVEIVDTATVIADPTLNLPAGTSEERDFSQYSPRMCSVWPHGYHFAVLDSGDLQAVLGHRFQQLAQAMKGIESRCKKD